MFIFVENEKNGIDEDNEKDCFSRESSKHRNVQLISEDYKNGMLSYFLKYSEHHNKNSYVTEAKFLEMLNNHDVENDTLSEEEFKQCYFMSNKTKEGGLSLGGFAECFAYCAETILGRIEYEDLYDSIALRVCVFFEMWGFALYNEENE